MALRVHSWNVGLQTSDVRARLRVGREIENLDIVADCDVLMLQEVGTWSQPVLQDSAAAVAVVVV